MSRYSIEGSTLTAIGDAIREKTNKPTRIETFPVGQNTFVVPVHPEDIDVTQLSDKNNYGQVTSYWYYTQDIVVPGAVKFQVNYTFDTNLVDSYAVYAFKENGTVDTSTSIFCNPNGTTSGKIIKTFHNKVRIDVSINKTYWEMKDYSYCDFEIIGLDVDGNPVTEYEAEVINTITPLEMAEEINNLQALPEEALTITGDTNYRFANDGWTWFIENYGNKIKTKNIIEASNMFRNSKNLKNIPFELNFETSYKPFLTAIFQGCRDLEDIPKINNANVGDVSDMFYQCFSLRELKEESVEGIDWSYIESLTSSYSGAGDSRFNSCYSLRKFPMSFLAHGNPVIGYNYSNYYSLFNNCYALDEVVGLPIQHRNAKWTSNAFNTTFEYCCRLKRLTFETNEDGSPIKIDTWSKQAIGLSGYVGIARYTSYITNYNSGIGTDKQVTDDASYQALKNDPDWWSIDWNYSRYNHDSAVETINTLPDLSGGAGGNTIKFKGVAGALTDGGAINTLTEEEIAVAAAKGWTVSLV